MSVSKKSVDDSNEEPDVCVIELGGTIGSSFPNIFCYSELSLDALIEELEAL
jgi:hypothetical protein